MTLRLSRTPLQAWLWLLVLAAPAWGGAAVRHHDLTVHLLAAEQALVASDRLTVQPAGVDRLSFQLTAGAEIDRVAANGHQLSWDFRNGRLRVELPPSQRTGEITLQIDYRAVFADQAPATPLNTEDPGYGVTGTISPHGAFLGGSAGWYPQLPGSLPTFRLRVEAPGMLAVSSGRLLEAVPGRTVWETSTPVRALALAAGPYQQHAARAGEVPVYAFFYRQSSDLAATYLQAAEDYLQLYQELFGPYPFAKFAVAENFFPTGYGFPSWTLLGSTVVRLPFIVATSLGHEIAHCWWGNGVWVDYRQGNWSEGLTTYVAEHLYQERQSPEAAREHRLKILRDYASLVSARNEIPLSAFVSRTTAAEQAIGYGKAAMVFHMARQQIGDGPFWQGLRQLAGEKLFQEVSWGDFALAFGRVGQTDLGDFFRQWVQRPGAPVLRLEGVRSESTGAGRWRISGTLLQ
ncbi:MAG: M1 family peptidase, partial [Desulfuromonadales bacterium]|nr:M1 family peptidase [Desulfuromonadales bacterium]